MIKCEPPTHIEDVPTDQIYLIVGALLEHLKLEIELVRLPHGTYYKIRKQAQVKRAK